MWWTRIHWTKVGELIAASQLPLEQRVKIKHKTAGIKYHNRFILDCKKATPLVDMGGYLGVLYKQHDIYFRIYDNGYECTSYQYQVFDDEHKVIEHLCRVINRNNVNRVTKILKEEFQFEIIQ